MPVYHSLVGTLRTSEEAAVAAGEGRKDETLDEDRHIDEGAKIIIAAGPADSAPALRAAAPAPVRRPTTAPAIAPKQGGAWLVVLIYLLAAAALAYAIYERYFMA